MLLPRPSLSLLCLLSLTVVLFLPSWAFAADDEEGGGDSSEGGSEEEGAEEEEESTAEEEEEAPKKPSPRKGGRAPREVVKGFFAKIQIGPTIWVPPISQFTSGVGTTSHFSLGYDFIDTLNFTMTVQASFFQLVTNGNGTGVQDGFVSPIQGDFRVLGGTAALRLGPNFGGKKSKRVNFSVLVGGGVGGSPLLVNPNPSTRIQDGIAYSGAIMQGKPLGLITPGIAIEYYTKLAHFSLGLDVTGDIIVGGPVIAVGVSPNVFLKYTF